jgi:hypothetical protein
LFGRLLICEAKQEERELLADRDVCEIGEDIGVGDVGYLIEALVGAPYLKSPFPVNFEITGTLSIFNRVSV